MRIAWYGKAASVMLLLAGLASAAAQEKAQPPLDALLVSLRAESTLYTDRLPSIACDEAIRITTPVFMRPRKVIEASAEIMVRRDATAAGPTRESRRLLAIDDRRVTAEQKIILPLLLNGGFIDGLRVFLDESVSRCLSYTSGKPANGLRRVDFASRLDCAGLDCKRVVPGLTGTALIAADGQHVAYLERTIPAELARVNRVSAFTSIEFAPSRFESETFWLPAHVSSYTGAHEITWEASYTNCRRFTAVATMDAMTIETIKPVLASTPLDGSLLAVK